MGLSGELFEIKSITEQDKNRMFQLMEMYYENVRRSVFLNDLMEKEWALLLKDISSVIQGFTTIKIFDLTVNDIPARLVFSGDTIVHDQYWGDLELHRVWIKAIYALLEGFRGKSYWLLISKGYKTYRFLPVYFYRFYPCFSAHTPEFEKKIMDTFGMMKYPGGYNRDTGIISFKGVKDYLKKGVADVSEIAMKDPHINFFVTVNPNHVYGDELVCLTELASDNLKPMALRYLRRSQ